MRFERTATASSCWRPGVTPGPCAERAHRRTAGQTRGRVPLRRFRAHVR
jgi:hypothetical protein